MAYSTDGRSRVEALATQKRLATLLRYNLKREYSEICGFVQVRMSLGIVRSNRLLSCGPREKGASIRQPHELTEVAVMELLAPWRG